jgi:hypothetical protein
MRILHALTVGNGRRTSRSINVTSWVDHRYLNSLRPTGLDQVPVLELLHTMFPDVMATSAETLAKAVDGTDFATDLYRDADNTLVVMLHDTTGTVLSLLWPIGLRPSAPSDATSIVGYRGNVFIVDPGNPGVVPLPAAAPGHADFSWGQPGPGAVSLYLAIVHYVQGSQAPTPRPRFQDHPDSLYGWLIRQDPKRELRLRWPDAVRMVRADAPLRTVARTAATHRSGFAGTTQAALFPVPKRAARAGGTTR